MTNRSSLSGLLTSICHCLRTPRLCGEKNVRRKEQYGMKSKAVVAQLGVAVTLLFSPRGTEKLLKHIEKKRVKVGGGSGTKRHPKPPKFHISTPPRKNSEPVA